MTQFEIKLKTKPFAYLSNIAKNSEIAIFNVDGYQLHLMVQLKTNLMYIVHVLTFFSTDDRWKLWLENINQSNYVLFSIILQPNKMKKLPLSTTRTLLAASSKSKGDPEGLRSKVKPSPSASVHCISADITELTSKNNYKGHHYNKPTFFIHICKKRLQLAWIIIFW